MKLAIQAKIDREIIHFAEDDTLISSKHRTVYYTRGKQTKEIVLPENGALKSFLGFFRLTRRALRLDKCNVFLHGKNLVIIRQGRVYFYDDKSDELSETLTLRNCRNILHQSMNSSPEGYIYFGEYGTNKERKTVPVYCSKDGGKSWSEIYTFSPGSIKHVHGCYYDKYTDKIWVCTGDFKDENWLLIADKDFQDIKKIGDGQQRYRTCNLIFTADSVHWLMDSQLETSYHITLDRKTEKITVGQKLMGPIWYIKELDNGIYLAASSQEKGEGVLDDNAHIYVSRDLKTWHSIHQFKHDGYPKGYFKFGVVGFADGKQSASNFYMFCEALKGVDGVSLNCQIEL
ncbi:MAG: hypothetical protein AAFP70_05755 [Calditrichota bacterium]